MKKVFIIIYSLSITLIAHAQSEIINSGIVAIWEGGAEDVFYNANNFNGHNFGTLTAENSLYLKSSQLIVAKDNNGGDIIDCDMYYRIYKTGEAPGEFINVNLPWHSNWVETEGWTTQMWWNDTPDETNLNILNGILPGTYNLEIYFAASNGSSTTLFLNNATLNYIAQFNYTGISAITKSRGVANTDIFDILPVPEDEKLSIQFITATNIDNIKMINNQSSVVYEGGKSRGAPGTPVDISIEDMEAGTYFIRVQTEKGISVQRVVIAK
jgi:hypothetical protein